MEKKYCPLQSNQNWGQYCKEYCQWYQEGDCSINHIAVALAVISEALGREE